MPAAVAGVVVTHGRPPDLDACLEALAPQVQELVVVANPPAPAVSLPAGARLLPNEKALGYAANANRGIAATSAPFVLLANPDAIVSPDAVAILTSFAEERPRCGVAGPELRFPDGSWQPSRRSFPTVSGTIVRRTPLRRILRPKERQRSHYLLDDRPEEPREADWLLGALLLLRRSALEELGGFDEGFRLYCEDIDLCYRAARAGWERWYVPGAVAVHGYDALTDRTFFTRRTIWHYRGMLRFVRKHPERLRALT